MRQAGSVLELGTGGGERFLQLRGHWPSRVTVTEEYPPNVALVRERLGSLGVRVVEVRLTDIDPLPFATDEFDVVLNRHSAFNSAEVARVLGPGGTFLTQRTCTSRARQRHQPRPGGRRGSGWCAVGGCAWRRDRFAGDACCWWSGGCPGWSLDRHVAGARNARVACATIRAWRLVDDLSE